MPTSQAGTCSSPEGADGFTLLELSVVVFIMSLLAAAVLPLFYHSGTDAIKADSRRLASLLRHLNDGAIYAKKTYLLRFDLKEKSLSWEGPDGEKTDRVGTIAGLNLESRGEIKDGQVTVFFSPLGLRENLNIILKSGDKQSKVMYNSLSGRVKIKADGD